jgi:hypothetical protein
VRGQGGRGIKHWPGEGIVDEVKNQGQGMGVVSMAEGWRKSRRG